MPTGHSYNRIYFLAASAGEDAVATFSTGNNSQEITVPSYTGFIGQWENLGHTEGFLKDVEIAYVGTHRHASDKDEAYEFTYMFKFGMDIPKGATTVTLPDHADIVLFAATLVNEKYPAVTPASELFRTALKADNGEEATTKTNLSKQAKLIKCSGETNEKEVARYAVDGDVKTKWCDTSTAPNYIDFDFGKEQTIRGWKLVNAGNEGSVFITHTCFLQGRNSPDEEWKTIDELSDNKKNTVVRQFKPTSVRYVRLLVTQSTQNNSLKAARIYELEVY